MERPLILSVSSVFALSMMMPMDALSLRMVSHREKPFIPGSMMSSTATSKPADGLNTARACSALAASVTS